MNPDAPGALKYQKLLDGGFSPQEADQWRQRTTQQLLEGGFAPKEIDGYWGNTEPDLSVVKEHVTANLSRLPPEEQQRVAENPTDMFLAGLDRSVSGLAVTGKLPQIIPPEHAGFFGNTLMQMGQTVGDIPAIVAGYVGGRAAGGAVGALAGPEGAMVGSVVGAGVGSAALPEAIRGALMDQYAHPEGAKTWAELWTRTAAIMRDTVKAGIVGGVAASVGGVAGGVALRAGTSRATATLADTTTQALAATTVGGALDGHVPDAQDFLSGAAIAVGFHAAGSIVGATGRFVASDTTKLVAENQRDIYKDTGLPPQVTSVPAERDVVLNTEVLAPHAADGTRVTPTLDAMRPPEPEPFLEPKEPKEGEPPLGPTGAEIAAAKLEEQNSQENRNARALAIQGVPHDELVGGGEPPQPPAIPREPAAGGEEPGAAPLQRSKEMLQEDILALIGQREDPSMWSSVQKFVAGFQSQLAPGNRLDRRLGLKGPEMSIADMMRQTYASASRAGQFYNDGVLGFKADKNGGVSMDLVSDDSYVKAYKQLKEDGGDPEELKAVRMAQRTVELAGRGIESGVDLETARQFLAQPGLLARNQRAIDTIQRVKDGAIRYMVDSGAISEKQAEAMKELNEQHIVLRRLIEPGYNPPSPTRGFGRRLATIKKIEGSERQIVDPDVAEIDNLHTMIAMADMNRARGNIIGLIESHFPEPRTLLEHMQAMQAMDLDTGESLRQEVLDENGKPISTNAKLAAEPFLAQRAKSLGQNDFIFYRNGRPEVWRPHDQDLADLMRVQGPIDQHGLMKIAASIANISRLGITGALDFPLRALFHGQIAAAAFSERSTVPFHDVIGGLMSAWNKDADYQRWVANGGADVALNDLRDMHVENIEHLFEKTGTFKAVFNAFPNPIDALRAGYHMIDAAARVGYMKRVENQGLSALKAATISRTAYLDHAEGRAHAWLRQFATTVPFMEIGFKDIEQVLAALRDRPIGTLLKASAYITAPTVINYALNALADQNLPPEDRYDQLPRWERDMYWVLPPINGVRMKIKKPYVGGFIFGTMPERFLDSIRGQDGFKEWAETAAAQALPPLIPSIISPVAEQWANRSLLTGRPLIKATLEKNSGWMQYNPDTTETAKRLSQWMGPAGVNVADVSPIIVQNYVSSWTGTLPMTLLRALEQPYKPPARPQDIVDLPFVGAFFARQPQTTASSIQDFYDDYDKVQEGASDLRVALKHGNQREIQLALTEDAALKGLSRFADSLRNMSAVVTAIDASNMTDDEKRKRTDQIASAMIQVSQAGSQTIKQFHEARARIMQQ
jgi:hypothetical protein